MFCEVAVEQPFGQVSRLTVAFDCGSINREHLRQGIETLDREELDILFISHLDADHVNGIDLLLDQTKVNTVVLPCLDPLTTTAVVCSSLNAGGMTGDFRSFLVNPVTWFAQRGVGRVIFVPRGLDSDNGPLPFSPNDQGPPSGFVGDQPRQDKGRLPIHVTGDGQQGPKEQSTPAGKVLVQTLRAECALTVDLGIRGSMQQLSWLLLPYVHPFPEARVKAFVEAVKSTLKIPDGEGLATPAFKKKLLDALKEERTRTKLKECYALLSRNNNKPSMSLYSGPYPNLGGLEDGLYCHMRHGQDVHFSRRFDQSSYYWRFNKSQHGWLTTGDADLSSKGTREAWLRRYEMLLEHVVVFVLPHHGSNSSIHDRVITQVQGALAVACAADGRVHHPHPILKERLALHSMALCQVSERIDSQLSFTLDL